MVTSALRLPLTKAPEFLAEEDLTRSSFSLSVLVPVYNERYLVETSLRRVLALKDNLIHRLELIVVDDCSTDGSWEVLKLLASEDDRIILLRHERNMGKGAALRTALEYATGDISIVHDADLEYCPADIPSLLRPFATEAADAVFGSRYLSSSFRRALVFRHTIQNRLLTFVANMFTDLNLSDIETCYKAIRTSLFQSIPLRNNDFRFEIEIAFKLAKRHARIFEAPISYLARNYQEGKKISSKDSVLAIAAILYYWLIDDLYKDDQYGSQILASLEKARRFNLWMGKTLTPFIGDRVLEIGSGIGTLTSQFIPREFYLASDINPNYISYLRAYSIGKPYLRVKHINADISKDFAGLEEKFDTVLMVNVLEHVPDEQTALKNIYATLMKDGKAVILVPQHPALYGALDRALDHRERYTRELLRSGLEKAGFRVERIQDFNRFSVPGWWLNGKALKRATFSPAQLKLLQMAMPILRQLDPILPWGGLSLIAVAIKE
ncbi:MAG: glycosyltransferase [Acidobacteriaceae bacterium]|nr:glycosyltransferase [Acidobacteriaceae bacterium]